MNEVGESRNAAAGDPQLLVAAHRDPEGFLESELRTFATNPDKYVADTFGRAA